MEASIKLVHNVKEASSKAQPPWHLSSIIWCRHLCDRMLDYQDKSYLISMLRKSA